MTKKQYQLREIRWADYPSFSAATLGGYTLVIHCASDGAWSWAVKMGVTIIRNGARMTAEAAKDAAEGSLLDDVLEGILRYTKQEGDSGK